MTIDQPMPFQEALDLLKKQQALPNTLSSAELEKIDAAIKRMTMFSARVNDAQILQQITDLVTQLLGEHGSAPGQYMNKNKAREILTDCLKTVGYEPETGKAGSIQDLMSAGRQNLILGTLTDMGNGYGQFVQGNTEAVLDAFPAAELFRLFSRMKPRDWQTQIIGRWAEGGGEFYDGGRMIALKDDPVWFNISRFGNPYPPYDYNSGMWRRDVSREYAVRLGLISWDAKVKPVNIQLGDRLSSGVATLSQAILSALLKSLGPGYSVKNGILGAG